MVAVKIDEDVVGKEYLSFRIRSNLITLEYI